jgi:predicted peptidase
MRNLFVAFLFAFSITAWNCKDEEEITPAPAAAELKKDSTIVSATAEPVVTDSVANVSADSVQDSTIVQNSGLDLTDSAYYQRAKNGNMPYRVMVPSGYDQNKKYPLVIFLHGIDERGTDNEKQLKWGASLFKSDSVRKNHPSYVIFPQCPSGYYWAENQPMQMLRDLISDFAAKNNVDRNKIYIVGMSMGAYGTYEMVARNPDLFAAAIAISGDGDLNRSRNMTKTDWKIYAGKKDTIVASEKSEKMAQALKNSGATVSLKVYPDANHVGSWVKAFEEPDFCSWLYSVSK